MDNTLYPVIIEDIKKWNEILTELDVEEIPQKYLSSVCLITATGIELKILPDQYFAIIQTSSQALGIIISGVKLVYNLNQFCLDIDNQIKLLFNDVLSKVKEENKNKNDDSTGSNQE